MDCKGQLKDAVTLHRLLAPEPAQPALTAPTMTAAEVRQDLEIIEAMANTVQQFTRALAERYYNSPLRDSHLAEQIEFLRDDTDRLRRYIARLQGRR